MRVLFLIFTITFICPISSRGAASGLDTAVSLLTQLDDAHAQADVLRGISAALRGRRRVSMPPHWPGAYDKLISSSDPDVRQNTIALALIFGDPRAIASLTATMNDRAADAKSRRQAIEALVQSKEPGLASTLIKLLDDPAVRGAAIRGLGAYDDPQTPGQLLARYKSFTPIEHQDALNTLVSRASWAVSLLDAVRQNQVPRTDVSAYTIRQLAALNDPAVNDRLKKIWGSMRPPASDKAKVIAQYKKTFTPDVMAKADPSHGRAIFAKTCSACHTLFGAGGNVGPDLTGSQRANLDYVLENVVDPSAVVAKDYLMTLIQTKDGRTITGIIKHEDDKSLLIRTTTEDISLPIDEIRHRKTSPISMMPEGLLESMSTEDARDLIAYLASPGQVQMK